MDSRVQAVKAHLLEMDTVLKDLAQDRMAAAPHETYDTYLTRLNDLAATPVREDQVRALMTDAQLQSALPRLSRFKRRNGLRLEIGCAKSLISVSDPWDHLQRFVYYVNYLTLARMEYQGAGLHAQDRVIFLGSGPLPLTLICLWKHYGIEGVGIEQDRSRARLSTAVIRKLGLEHRIRVICGNHFALSTAPPCNLIMVGADARPKSEIFSHLAEILEPGRMISYRVYEKGLRRLFDAAAVLDLPPQFRECGRVRPQPPVNNTCVFAVRTP
ncbi:MAG: methyltransferase [Deltaproteobacteria bacterium]|nr:methyltransferase [Deltaproteobacteria bacterium]